MSKVEKIGLVLVIIGILILVVPLIIGSFIIHPVLGCVVLGVALIVFGGFLGCKADEF